MHRLLSPPQPLHDLQSIGPPLPCFQLLILCSLSKAPAVSSIMHLSASQGANSYGKMLPCTISPLTFVRLQDTVCFSHHCL